MSLECGEARLTIEVAAVTDFQFAVRNHIHTYRAVPLFLEGIRHLLEGCLDVFGDGHIITDGVEDGVLDDGTVVVCVGCFVKLGPSERHPLTGSGELGLEGRNCRCGRHLVKYNKGGFFRLSDGKEGTRQSVLGGRTAQFLPKPTLLLYTAIRCGGISEKIEGSSGQKWDSVADSEILSFPFVSYPFPSFLPFLSKMFLPVVFDYFDDSIYDHNLKMYFHEDMSLAEEFPCGTKQTVYKNDDGMGSERQFIVRERPENDLLLISIRMNDGNQSRQLNPEEIYIIMLDEHEANAPDFYKQIQAELAEQRRIEEEEDDDSDDEEEEEKNNINAWDFKVPHYGTTQPFWGWLADVMEHAKECAAAEGNTARFDKMVSVLELPACASKTVRFQMVWSLDKNEEVWRTSDVAGLNCLEFLKAVFALYRDNESQLGDHIYFEGVEDGVAHFGS